MVTIKRCHGKELTAEKGSLVLLLCCTCTLHYLCAVCEGGCALLNKRLEGWLLPCLKSWLNWIIHEKGRVEPPKLIVNLTILIHGWFLGKWPRTKIFTNFRLCDLAVITSCGYGCQITDTDMSLTEIGGGGRIKKFSIKALYPWHSVKQKLTDSAVK